MGKSIFGSLIFLHLLIPFFAAAQTGERPSQRKITDYAVMKELTEPLQWPSRDATPTGGWLETTWTQDVPYKDACPEDTSLTSSPNSAVGCIGTALAQVVHYHQNLGNLHFTFRDRYLSPARGIRVDQDSLAFGFPGFGELNRRVDILKEKYRSHTALDSSDLAALCFALGVVIKMDYTGGASTTVSSDVDLHLKEKLGYAAADLLTPGNTFYQQLTENMINGQPAILFLNNHAVVVDGYRSDGTFHFNFGLGSLNPDNIRDTWYHPDKFPDPNNLIDNGILNISPDRYLNPVPLSVSGESIEMPCSEIGKLSDSRNLILKNTGDVPLRVDHLLIPEPFSSSFQPEQNDLWLNPGKELSISLHCRPEYKGKITDHLQLIFSSPTGSHYRQIEIIGNGVEKPGTTVEQLMPYTVWGFDGSPYYINRSLMVPAGGKLIIEKGTEVIFTGRYRLTIGSGARLSVRGSLSDSVYFAPLCPDSSWCGIFIQETEYSDSLLYCKISGVDGKWLPNCENALTARNADLYLSHCVFENNRSDYFGGALHLSNSNAVVSDCVFRDNICTATDGGGALHLQNSTVYLSHVLLHHNRSKKGAAIYGDNASLDLVNVTITDNKADLAGGAVYMKNSLSLLIKNSIIWGNQINSVGEGPDGLQILHINFSDVSPADEQWLGGVSARMTESAIENGEGNLDLDPMFYDPGSTDYRLQTASPCIDSGDPDDEFSMEPEPNGGRINMGAFGGTVLAAVTALPTALVQEQAQPYAFSLSQNYPNPFNGTTVIEFTLPSTEKVSLEIYNILGQKVQTILNQSLPAGSHQVKIDTGDLASGLYIYRLQAGTYNDFKKMVLVK